MGHQPLPSFFRIRFRFLQGGRGGEAALRSGAASGSGDGKVGGAREDVGEESQSGERSWRRRSHGLRQRRLVGGGGHGGDDGEPALRSGAASGGGSKVGDARGDEGQENGEAGAATMAGGGAGGGRSGALFLLAECRLTIFLPACVPDGRQFQWRLRGYCEQVMLP